MIKIFDNIYCIDKALFFKKQKLLVISDLQIGQESYLANSGIFVPQFQTNEMIINLKSLIKKTNAQTVLINGDFKHNFSSALNQEWREISRFILEIKELVKNIVIVKGNHDNFLQNILNQHNIRLVNFALIDEYLFLHGDKNLDFDLKKYTTLIIGHEQPAIVLRQGFEKFKIPCFLYGKTFDEKQFILLPSFSPLSSGVEINNIEKKDLLSPILKNNLDLDSLKVIAIDKDAGILKFPEIKKLRELLFF